jgi:hypothetical protein
MARRWRVGITTRDSEVRLVSESCSARTRRAWASRAAAGGVVCVKSVSSVRRCPTPCSSRWAVVAGDEEALVDGGADRLDVLVGLGGGGGSRPRRTQRPAAESRWTAQGSTGSRRADRTGGRGRMSCCRRWRRGGARLGGAGPQGGGRVLARWLRTRVLARVRAPGRPIRGTSSSP